MRFLTARVPEACLRAKAKRHGLDKRISSKTRLPVHVAEEPLRAVARGTAIALKNVENFAFLMRE